MNPPHLVQHKGPRRGRASAGAGRWAGDEQGALLILTGILLVLGFVVLGTTLVQLNASEDKVTRAQRDPLMETVDALVLGFSQGIRGGVELGDTNVDQFISYSEAQQERFRDTATQVGLYVDVELHPDPPLNIFMGPDKCQSYDILRSYGGVIIGFEKGTLTETVVGAVYTLEFTDGRQSVSMDYYVKVYDCTPGELWTFPHGLGQHMGAADPAGLPALRDKDDGHLGISAVEELTGTDMHTELAHIKIGKNYGWNSVENIIPLDKHATRPSPPVTDWLNLNLITNDRMNNTEPIVINDLKLQVHAKENVAVTEAQKLLGEGDNDYLQLRVYPPLDPLDPNTLLPYWTHNFTLTEAMQPFELSPPSPSGDPEWTLEEYRQTSWNFTKVVVGVHDDEHSFHLGYVRPEVTFAAPMGHQLELEFEWKEGNAGIPYSYGDHVVEAVYQIPGATPGEAFQVQAYDFGTETWDDIGSPWISDGSNWVRWEGALSEGEHYVYDGDPDVPRLRLVDKTIDDAFVTDRDTVHIDYFGLRSGFLGPPGP